MENSDTNITINEIHKYREKLIDMSMNNRLLNFRDSNSLKISGVDENITDLFNILVLKEKEMSFLPKNNNSLDLDNTWHEDNSKKDSYVDEFLQTNLEKDKLDKWLLKSSKNNKSMLEEKGFNSLYLALGFLEWVEPKKNENKRAPLILVPVELTRKSIKTPFEVSWNKDEVIPNLSLQYKLSEQYIEFPLFEELNNEEDVKNYLIKISNLVEELDSWKVTHDIYIFNLNFNKLAMYKDLDLNNWKNINSNSINYLFSENKKITNVQENNIDNKDSKENFTVLDADSSQLEVIEEVKKGKNIVVEGPPGTGKSQTIVNIMSELLANDKSILFVSEKKAALDVVNSRMKKVGLDDACLEIHGAKYNKRNFIHEIRKTLTVNSKMNTDLSDYDQLNMLKNDLNNYSDIIYTEYGNTGLKPYDIITLLDEVKTKLEDNNQEIYEYIINNPDKITKKQQNIDYKYLSEITGLYNNIRPIKDNYWNKIDINGLDLNNFDDLYLNIDLFNESYLELMNLKEDIISKTGLNESVKWTYNKLLNEVENLEKTYYCESIQEIHDLINDIEKYQKKVELINNKNSINLNTSEYIKALSEINNSLKNSIILTRIVETNYDKVIKFKNLIDLISSSPVKNKQNDVLIEEKLNRFIELSNSRLKKFNKDYKNLRNEFAIFYPYKVEDERIIFDLTDLINKKVELDSLKKEILVDSKFNLPYEDIYNECEKIRIILDNKKQIIKELSNTDLSFNNDDIPTVITYLNYINNVQTLQQKIKCYDDIGHKYLEHYKSYNSDTNKLNDDLKKYEIFNDKLDKGTYTSQTITFINSSDGKKLTLSSQLNEKYTKTENYFKKFSKIMNFNQDINLNNMFMEENREFEDIITELISNKDSFRKYNQFIKHCKNCTNDSINKLIEFIREDKIQPLSIIDLYNYNFYNNCINDIEANNEILERFSYISHNNKIQEFKKLDKKLLKTNQMRVKKILDDKRPSINSSNNPNSPLGFLSYEIQKKSKFFPIRQTLSKISPILSDIKPCLMMSPISIAEYLDPNKYESYFDYVIFDEASQVKVEDALGALLRGKHYVIIGDTKQLPPTSFFENSSETEDYEDNMFNTAGIQSILDLCITPFEYKMLQWHYRSRHESLIAFSNNNFYEKQLNVFPSTLKQSNSYGIQFVHDPDAIYDKGNSRQNIQEAKNIVNYAMNIFKKYGFEKSVGVGTFSKSQSDAITEQLENKLQEYPEMYDYFNSDRPDGFFIKNLENIQGDERDIILISIGYGFDKNHKLSNSFGPLTKEGGENRLNVLITRAKESCVIFSNFKAEDLQLTENSSKGSKILKDYLYYAEHKKFIQGDEINEFNSKFEEHIYNFLTEKGYLIEKQVGVAEYKIDMALIDPDNKNRYLLAIECDGENYHSSQTTRDRDRLRQEVLENLGWNFYRIWSWDWFQNRKDASKRLLNTVENVLKNKNDEKIETENFTQEFISDKKDVDEKHESINLEIIQENLSEDKDTDKVIKDSNKNKITKDNNKEKELFNNQKKNLFIKENNLNNIKTRIDSQEENSITENRIQKINKKPIDNQKLKKYLKKR